MRKGAALDAPSAGSCRPFTAERARTGGGRVKTDAHVGEECSAPVATSAAVVPGRPHGAAIAGSEVVLLRTRAGLRAYEGRCPHQGALLAEGDVDHETLVCRNHGWRFDAVTGRRLGGPESLCAYAVREQAGQVWVAVEPAPPVPGPAAARRLADLPGPRGLPIMGNLLQIDFKEFHAVLERWAEAHGALYRFGLGPRQALVGVCKRGARRRFPSLALFWDRMPCQLHGPWPESLSPARHADLRMQLLGSAYRESA